jgi:hypothetical protein
MEVDDILHGAVDAFGCELGRRLLAAYALGSTAHGGFSPLVSDIDLGLVVADPLEPGDAVAIQAVADAQRTGGSALASRLSVFWASPAIFRGEGQGGRFPALDRLDLIENGRLLAGSDVRDRLPRPSARDLLVDGAEFALEFLAGTPVPSLAAAAGLGSMAPATEDAVREVCDPSLLLAAGTRRLTKLSLFPVRFQFTAATGRAGSNAEAVTWYLDQDPAPAAALVRAALTWRQAPPADATAAPLLREQLPALYLQYIDDHIERLTAAEQPVLVQGFTQWRTRLLRELAAASGR